jgi:hypothetical protein
MVSVGAANPPIAMCSINYQEVAHFDTGTGGRPTPLRGELFI